MAARTIARLFDDHATAEAAVHDLESAGFSDADISLVRRQAGGTAGATTDTDTSGAGIGATIGGVSTLAGVTRPVSSENASYDPPPSFTATTPTAMWRPTSAGPRPYVVAVTGSTRHV